jgi:hypothetical protein
MPTWQEIQQHARGKYRLAKDEPDRFAIVFRTEGTRSQQIWVRYFRALGGEYVEFRSYFCKQDELAPVVALRKNGEMAIGSIALLGEHYAVRWTAPLADMALDEFEMPLHAVAIRAEEFEKTYSSGNDAY